MKEIMELENGNLLDLNKIVGMVFSDRKILLEGGGIMLVTVEDYDTVYDTIKKTIGIKFK